MLTVEEETDDVRSVGPAIECFTVDANRFGADDWDDDEAMLGRLPTLTLPRHNAKPSDGPESGDVGALSRELGRLFAESFDWTPRTIPGSPRLDNDNAIS